MIVKDFSEAVRDTKAAIFQVLNASGLPLDAQDLLLCEIKLIVHSQAEETYNELLRKKWEEEQARQKKAAAKGAEEAEPGKAAGEEKADPGQTDPEDILTQRDNKDGKDLPD